MTTENESENQLFGINSNSEECLKDLAHGYASGVDREGRNIKGPSKEQAEEEALHKKYPNADVNLMRLMQKYGPHSRD